MSVVAVLGGSGAQGKGLALRLAIAGHEVVLGSRSAERPAEVAETVNDRVGPDSRVTRRGECGGVRRC
jgi:predicted dinucleotide-binding enzyme